MHTDTIIIGAGQAGLALSRILTEQGRDHVVLERGRVAQRWRSERWDSLRLLTPNWMTRLPGWAYHGDDPDGFMRVAEVIDFLERYARSFGAPVLHGTTVQRVERLAEGFAVVTDRSEWTADNVVIATGGADRPYVPRTARHLAGPIHQMTPDRYRNPAQLPDGGVLVVGASATGVQIAEELAGSGRPVVLAVGNHSRAVRTYRGHDLFRWLDRLGVLDKSIDAMPDPERARREPSLQLVGRDDHRTIDLRTLAASGVTLTGRLLGARGSRVHFADDLALTTARADARLRRVLHDVDAFIDDHRLAAEPAPRDAVEPVPLGDGPHDLDLTRSGIRTVVWATGYRRQYPWLHVPGVLDRRGELVHRRGITPAPGLYVLGLRFQSRRNSNFIDGVRHDAAAVAAHIGGRTSIRELIAI